MINYFGLELIFLFFEKWLLAKKGPQIYYLVDSPKVFKILNLGMKEQDNIHFKKLDSEFGLF